MNASLLSEVTRFGKVGLIGFILDGGILAFLFHVMYWGHYESRAVSFTVAVLATWYLNRVYTFKDTGSGAVAQYVKYFSIQVVGAIINLSIYVVLIASLDIMRDYPLLPLSIGAGVAMIFNYTISRMFVFTGGRVEENR